ncbi:MAG: response regulator transcription factor [Spirochaetaceae bacterium]|jgi:DNA-binding NarL/FixJ family response regulator|nr:response regulator transcription factor [Spirochaetaceae bacterium]
MIRIVIVESQELMRLGLTGVLSAQEDFQVVGTGVDGYDALKLCEDFQPDVAILNLDIPLISGIKVTPSIKLRSPATSIILLIKKAQEDILSGFLECGASGIVFESSVYEEIYAAIRQVVKAESYYLSSDITSALVRRFTQGDLEYDKKKVVRTEPVPMEPFSPMLVNKTEMQIASFIGQGLSNREIANLLEFKEGTVRNYISFILQKTGLKHRTQIAIYAFNNGFADRGEIEKRSVKHTKRLPAKPAYRKHHAIQNELATLR